MSSELQLPGYRIEEPIGKGGMGMVYKAVQTALDRIVAIKILPPHLAEDHEFVTSFAQEAKTVAKLDHPNIVSVYDFGTHEGVYYLVMQYVDGRTLRELLMSHKPPIEQVIAILKQVGAALDYAHSKEVVHRDVKPSNIMLCPDGKAMIMDFGVACGSHASDLSAVWSAVGTPNYMAPEQCKGKKASPRSDQYSMGATVYEMLAGRVPFKGDNASILQQHLSATPAPLRGMRQDVNPRMEAAVMRAMAKLPEVRFETLTGFAKEFEAGYYEPTASSSASATTRPSASSSMLAPGSPVCLVGSSPMDPQPVSQKPSTSYPTIYATKGGGVRRSSPVPWILVLLILGALGAAGYVLYPKLIQPTEPAKPTALSASDLALKKAKARRQKSSRSGAVGSAQPRSSSSQPTAGVPNKPASDSHTVEAGSLPAGDPSDTRSDDKPDPEPKKEDGGGKSNPGEE